MDTQTSLIVGKVKNQTPTLGEHWHIPGVGRKHMRDKYQQFLKFGSLYSKNNDNVKKSNGCKYTDSSYKTDPKEHPHGVNYKVNFIGRMS